MDGGSADPGIEGKAPGVVFVLEAGDACVLLVAIVRNGVTLSSRYFCIWACFIALYATQSANSCRIGRCR